MLNTTPSTEYVTFGITKFNGVASLGGMVGEAGNSRVYVTPPSCTVKISSAFARLGDN